MSNSARHATGITFQQMRDSNHAGARAIAHINRLGFVDGFCGATLRDEREVWAWVVAKVGQPGRPANDYGLQKAGEAYANGRLMGAEMATEYPDAIPERLAKIAAGLWPEKTAFPRGMEKRMCAVLDSFARSEEWLAEEDEEINPYTGQRIY